jgi:hypothetical protein
MTWPISNLGWKGENDTADEPSSGLTNAAVALTGVPVERSNWIAAGYDTYVTHQVQMFHRPEIWLFGTGTYPNAGSRRAHSKRRRARGERWLGHAEPIPRRWLRTRRRRLPSPGILQARQADPGRARQDVSPKSSELERSLRETPSNSAQSAGRPQTSRGLGIKSCVARFRFAARAAPRTCGSA